MSQPDYDDIRQRITKRYENRIEFFGHLVGFLVVNALIWSGALVFPALNCISAAWFLGLAIHFVNFVMAEARERAIERAIQEERSWTSGEKPKRDPRVYLTEDGELEEIADEDDVEPPSQQRHR